MQGVDKYIKLIYATAILFLTIHICRMFTETGLIGWYEFSYKPAMTPVNEVFPIVWTIMYILIGASFFIAIKDLPLEEVHKYNNVIALVLTAFRMIRVYNEAGRWSGNLLYPYLFWLLYATILNLNFVIELGSSVAIQ